MTTLRVVMSGTIGQAQQTWSTGFDVFSTEGVEQGQLQTFADQVKADLDTWATASGGLKAYIGSATTINRLRVYRYSTPPVGSASQVAESTTPPAIAGTAATIHPSQIALVLSLRGVFLGASERGRMYLPAGGASVSAGVMSTPTAAAVATAAANFFAAVRGHSIGGEPIQLVVGPSNAEITKVVVDNVLDTQRSRRNKIAPTATATAAIPVG